MAAVNIESSFPPGQRFERLSRSLTGLLPYLSGFDDIIPRDTLLWKLNLLKSAAAYANSRLHAVKAEVLVLASGKDNMLPSRDEAERLKNSLQDCVVRHFKDNGHTLLLTNELYQLASVAFCLLVAWCSDKLGPSLELGSFAAGVMISTTDLAQHTLGTIKYEVRLEDGTLIAKSEGVEFTVKEGCFCPALSKAVKTMKKGEKVLLTVKPQSGFGEKGRPASGDQGAVPPNATLQITLELVSWKTVSEITDDKKVIKKILKEGEGYERPNDGSVVKLKLIGKLQDGTVFLKKGHGDGDQTRPVLS